MLKKLVTLYATGVYVFGFALVTILVTQVPLQAGDLTSKFVEKSGEEIKEALQPAEPAKASLLDSLSVSFTLNALKASLGSGSQFKLGLKGSVRPSYLKNYYTRQESLIPSFDFDLSKAFGKLTMHVYVKPSIESSFFRRFDNTSDAYDFFGQKSDANKPYGLDRIPSHNLALDKMELWDTFKYRNELEVFVAPLDRDVGHIASATVKAGWTQGGALILSITKLPLDHAELKLIAIKKKGPQIKYEAGIGSAFGFGAHGFLLKSVASYINRRFLRWNFTKGEKHGLAKINLPDMKYRVFIADFVLDMSDPTVVAAYNRLVPQYFVYHEGKPSGIAAQKVMQIIDPTHQNMSTIVEAFNNDLQELNNMYYEDLSKGMMRVDRKIYASQESMQDYFFERTGADFITYTQSSSMAARDRIYILDDENKFHEYEHYIAEDSNVFKGTFGVNNHAEIKSVDALCTKVDSENDCKMELGFHFEVTSSNFKYDEQEKFFEYLKLNLPENIYKDIPLSLWKDGRDKKNVYIHSLILFKKGFADLISEDAKRNLRILFDDYLNRIDYSPVDINAVNELQSPLNDNPNAQLQAMTMSDNAKEQFKSEKDIIIKELDLVLDRTQPDRSRMESILRLRSNALFQKHGAGFLFEMMAAANPESRLFAKVQMSAANAPQIQYPQNYAKSKQALGAQIYEAFTTIQSQINRAINPQLQNEQTRLTPGL